MCLMVQERCNWWGVKISRKYDLENIVIIALVLAVRKTFARGSQGSGPSSTALKMHKSPDRSFDGRVWASTRMHQVLLSESRLR